MMLARSPAPTPSVSANASPGSSLANFHYAPAPSPRQASPRVPAAAKSLRQPASSSPASIASTSVPRPKRYVAVDAATQYSPMEPMDYATGTLLSRKAPAVSEPLDPPPVSGPTSMALLGDRPPAATQSPVRPSKAAVVVAKQPITSQALSPSKRRNSQGPGSSSNTVPLDALQTNPTLSKRAKPERAPKILPQRYEHCPVEDMVVLIAHMLGELIETNDTLALKSGHLTRFHSRTAPGISVLDYLHRLAKHATLTPPLLLSMVYYIDRLCALYPDFTINTLTVHRFLITAATVAAKGLSDAFWNNSTYARVGGVKVQELKLLELEFLHRVDWKIVPNPEVLVAYYKGLVDRTPGYTLQAEEGSGESEDIDDSDAVEDDIDDVEEAHEEAVIGDEARVATATSKKPLPSG